MPWIEHRGRGWAVRTRDDAGRQHWLTGVLPERDDAQAWLERSGWSSKREVPLAALIDRWVEAQGRSPHALDVSARLAGLCRSQAWTVVGDVSLRALEAWNVSQGGRGRTHSGRGVDRCWQYLRTILRWAHQVHGVAVDDQVLAAGHPRRQRRPPRQLLSEDHIAAILARGIGYGQSASGLLGYLITYGARPITACRLRRRDCDPVSCMLTIPIAKSSGGWSHPITSGQASAWLAAASSDPDGPLFPHWREPRSWRITRGRADEVVAWYRRCIARPLKRSGQVPGWHSMYDLKRRAISRALGLGLDAATIALFTGHLKLDQVLRYAKTNETIALAALGKLCPQTCPHAPTPD